VGADLRLPSKLQKPCALDTWWRATRLFAQSLGLFQKALIE
jgi:hypothetical protein